MEEQNERSISFLLMHKNSQLNVKLMGITEGNTLSFVDDMSTSCKQNKQSTEREKQDEKLHGV